MTARRISELASIGLPLTLAEMLPAVQGGATTRISLEEVRGGRVVSIRDFGGVGDGAADDTAAFKALHARLFAEQRADPDLHAVISLPPGRYRYSWNRWLWGLRHVTVHGYGARLQCIAESEWNLDKFALVTNRNPFTTMGVDQPGLNTEVNLGCLIETAAVGASTVKLRNTGDASRFTPGRVVLVMSFDQQFTGFPPNCRYFDYAIVTAMNGSSVMLDRPLLHAHRADYPEIGDSSVGPARILDVDRDDVPFARHQTLLGLTLLPNPHIAEANAQYLLAQGALSFVARDCALEAFVSSTGHDFTIDHCSMAYAEPDKLVSTLTFSNCRIGVLTQATGVDRLEARSCSFAGKAQAQARLVTFDGCTFEGAALAGEYQRGIDLVGFAPIRAVNVVNSQFTGKGGVTDAAIGPVGTPSNGFTTIKLDEPLVIRGRQGLLIPKTDKRAMVLLRNLDIGDCIWFGTEINGDLMCDGRYGFVEAIRAEGGGIAVDLFLSAPLTPKDLLVVPRMQRLRCVGNVYTNVNTPAPVSCATTFETAVVNSERYTFRLRSDFTEILRIVSGSISSIAFNVLRPYSGPDADACLRMELKFPSVPAFLQSIDLRQAGLRGVDARGILGATPLDALAPLPTGQFSWLARFSCAASVNGRSATPAGQAFELAECIVTIETQNPFQIFS